MGAVYYNYGTLENYNNPNIRVRASGYTLACCQSRAVWLGLGLGLGSSTQGRAFCLIPGYIPN